MIKPKKGKFTGKNVQVSKKPFQAKKPVAKPALIKDVEDEMDFESLEDVELEEVSVFTNVKPSTKPVERVEDLDAALRSASRIAGAIQAPSDSSTPTTKTLSEITPVDTKELDRLAEEQKIRKQEKVIQMKGTVKYYGPSSLENTKETNENVKNQTIDILMSQYCFSFLEARAEVEERMKTMSLGQIRTEATSGKITKDIAPKVNSGVQSITRKNNVNYY